MNLRTDILKTFKELNSLYEDASVKGSVDKQIDIKDIFINLVVDEAEAITGYTEAIQQAKGHELFETISARFEEIKKDEYEHLFELKELYKEVFNEDFPESKIKDLDLDIDLDSEDDLDLELEDDDK